MIKKKTINKVPATTAANIIKNIAEKIKRPLNLVIILSKKLVGVVVSGLMNPSLTASFTDLVKSSSILFSFFRRDDPLGSSLHLIKFVYDPASGISKITSLFYQHHFLNIGESIAAEPVEVCAC